jgi:uncharacterized membrane protein YdjX (TVP38/TMEM64 family)/Fe-S oxidoreductase
MVKGKHLKKVLCAVVMLLPVALFFAGGFHEVLTFEGLKASQAKFTAMYAEHPVLVVVTYIAIYIFCIALSLPGATILGLAGGALFGAMAGTIVVSFASTAGATIACGMARYIFQDWVQDRFGSRLETVHSGIAREGHFYLFSMRLIPVIPFFVINLVMGLTRIPLRTFAWVSQLGMLPGTFVYVNAGSQIAALDSISGIFSAKLLFSFVLLGIFPLLTRKLLDMYKDSIRLSGSMQPSEALQSGGNMGGDLHKSAIKISAGCNGCGACVRACSFLQVYGSPKHIADRLLAADGMGRLTAFECSLCNLCGAVCPEKLAPVEMFLNMRRDAQQAGEVDQKKHSILIGYEKKGNSRLFSWYGLPKKCDTVFFPGCTFPGTRPQTAWALFDYIRRYIPRVGVVLDCCNKPSHDLGMQEEFLLKFGEMNRYLVKRGIRRILVACPNCLNVFKQYGHDLEIVSVYELINRYGVPATPIVENQCVLHDPCPLRNEPVIHAAIRSLIAAKGVTFSELQRNPSKTVCCGEGGAVGCVRPEFAKKWAKRRADQSAGKTIVTYCAGCANYLSRYATVWHVLDLIFFPVEVTKGRFKVVKAPFTYLHRLIYKKRLRQLLDAESDLPLPDKKEAVAGVQGVPVARNK